MMPDLWNAQDASQYSLQGAPATMQQPSVTASGGDPVRVPRGIKYTPKTQEDYEKIPPGEIYLDPDGNIYRKHAPGDVAGKRGIIT